MKTNTLQPLTKKQRKFKQQLNVAQGKLGNVGWWTTGVRSFNKFFTFVHGFISKLSKEQVLVLSQAGDIISYSKTGLNWLRNGIISIYNFLQIMERLRNPEKRFGNAVRALNIFSNAAFMGFDIALLVGVNGVANPIIIIFSSALNIFVRSLYIIKNIQSQMRDRARFNELNYHAPKTNDTSDEAEIKRDEIRELQFKLYYRKVRMSTRTVSLVFAGLSLAVVLIAIITANPMIYAALVLIGVANLAVGKFLRHQRYKKLNEQRIDLGLKPKLHYMTLTELKKHHEVLTQRMTQCSKYSPNYKELKADLVDVNFQICKSQWESKMMVFDLVMAGGMLAFGIAAILTANPLLFIGAAGLFVGLLIGKFIMTRKMNNELKTIKPSAFEEPSEDIEMIEQRKQRLTPSYHFGRDFDQNPIPTIENKNQGQDNQFWKKDYKNPRLSARNFYQPHSHEDISMVRLADDYDYETDLDVAPSF